MPNGTLQIPTERDPSFKGLIGVGHYDMTPEPGIYCHLWGSATHEQAESIHRPLYATAVSFQSAAGGQRVVVATIDYCWFPSHRTVSDLCDPIRAEFGLAREELLLIVTHSHSVPQIDAEFESCPGGDKIPSFREKLRDALRNAVRDALNNAEPAILAWARGNCTLARTRDFPHPDTGHILCGPNPAGEPDQTLLVGRVTHESSGHILATFVNYACHPVSLGGGNRAVSPDFVGAMREVLESHTAGAPCMFLHGPSGNQTPRDSYADDVAVADANGEILGFAALSLIRGMLPPGRELAFKEVQSSGAPLAIWETRSYPTDQIVDARMIFSRLPARSWPSIDEIDHAIATAPDRAAWTRMTRLRKFVENLTDGFGEGFPIWVTRLGRAVFVGIPAEAFTDLQITLRRTFPGFAVIVTNDTNGTFNYLPPAQYYGNGAYEQDCADFGPGALEIVTMEATRLIRTVTDDSSASLVETRGTAARHNRYSGA
jgi:hypothetical protein